jgi:hypothetical protein
LIDFERHLVDFKKLNDKFDIFVFEFKNFEKANKQYQLGIMDKIGDINHEINQIKMRNVKKDKDSNDTNKENERKFNEIRKNIETLFNDLDETTFKVKTITTSFTDNLSEKDSQLSQIFQRLDNFANIEHIKALKEFFIPKFEEFTGKIDEFMEENLRVRECIIRFDETICDKAQKSEIFTMRETLEKSFISLSKAEEINDRIDRVLDVIRAMDQQRSADLEVLKDDLELEFKGRIDGLLDDTFKKYDKVEKSFSRFFNSDDLEVNFARKANVEHFEDLQVKKAGRDELKSLSERVDSLFERMKHLAVLQREISIGLQPIQNSIGPFDF